MARTAAAGYWSLGRACGRTLQRCLGVPSLFLAAPSWLAAAPSWLTATPSWLAAGLVLIGLMFPCVVRAAEPIKGDATFSASGGYARLVLKLAEDVESEVVTAG